MDSYTFDQHRHNYATWTAARAVQRRFTSTRNIKVAIDKSDLRRFSEDSSDCTLDAFEEFHKKCSNQLIDAFKELSIPTSYGQAAKIISIYLKTSIILCNEGKCSKSKVIHPPIDSILLTKMASEFTELRKLKFERWTKLDEAKYWNLVSELRSHFNKLDWTLEFFWTPEKDK